jgi:hypothetical protein
MPDPVARQRPARRHDHRRDRRHLGDARQGPDAIRIEIGSGEDAAYPGHGSRRCCIDAFECRVSVGRAQHDAVQLAGHIDVVKITPLPG